MQQHPPKLHKIRSLPHGQAWALAWPMIVSNMSVPLMGLADTAMLGHLDDPIFLGAVAIGSNIIALFYWMFSFLRMGTTSVAAQAVGAQQSTRAVMYLTQNIGVAAALGLGLILLQSLLIPFAVWLIAPDEALMAIALEYCHIRIYSAPAVLITYVAMGWLIALNKPKIPLIITITSNLLNVLLDYLLIVQWQLDARGAAYATLVAEYFACICSLLYIVNYLKHNRWWPKRWFDSARFSEVLGMNRDLFIRTIALLFVLNFFNAQSALFGNDVLASNALLFQCMLFVAFVLDGYALAAETMTAQAIGGRHQRQFYAASAVTCITAFVIALALSLVFALFGRHLIDLLTDLPAVAASAKQHLTWLVILPIVSVWCYALDGIFVGAGKAHTMRNSMLLSVFVGFLPAWWLLRPFDNHGLWLAFVIFNGFRGVSLGLAYLILSRQHRWFKVVSDTLN